MTAKQATAQKPSTMIDLNRIKFRMVHPTDVYTCLELEQNWKPQGESSTKIDLQYRQHHAARYFRCSVYHDEEDGQDGHGHNDDDDDPCHIIGFICATRCYHLEDVMSPEELTPSGGGGSSGNSQSQHANDNSSICSTNSKGPLDGNGITNAHDIHGPLLVLHSVVLREDLRSYSPQQFHATVKTMLKEYVSCVRGMVQTGEVEPIQQIVRVIQPRWLELYVQSGFTTVRPSQLKAGHYEAEIDVVAPSNNNNKQILSNYRMQSLANFSSTSNLGGFLAPSEPTALSVADMDHPCYIVDAFCTSPTPLASSTDTNGTEASYDVAKTGAGTGNPAAVVVLPPKTEPDTKEFMAWSQRIAAEFNLSETAFLIQRAKKIGDDLHYTIRYFTPTTEIPLCGHATLASAAVVYQSVANVSTVGNIVFYARDEVLTVNLLQQPTSNQAPSQLNSNGSIAMEAAAEQTPASKCTKISMEFPSKPAAELESESDRLAVIEMMRSAFDFSMQPIFIGLSQVGDLLIEVQPEDFQRIGYGPTAIKYSAFLDYEHYSRGVIMCCEAPKARDGSSTRPSNASLAQNTGSTHRKHLSEKDAGDQQSLINCADADADDDDGSHHEYSDHDRPLSDDELMPSPSFVSSNAPEQVDFWSRFFGPKAGIDEDPVTGSAHCALAPYFANKLNKSTLIGLQSSQRSGVVECRVKDDCVVLSGTARTVMHGTLFM